MGAQQSMCKGFKQTLTLPVLLEWARRRQFRPFQQQSRQEPCHFGEPDPIERCQSRTKGLCPQPVYDRRVGKFFLHGIAVCDSGGDALPSNLREQGFGQACLAYACLP